MHNTTLSTMGRGYWVGFIVLLSLGFIAGALLFHRFEVNRIGQQKYLEIKAIARFKAEQIGQWRTQRLSDVALTAQSPFFLDGARAWSRMSGPAGGQMGPIRHPKHRQKHEAYSDILLVSPKGHILFSQKDSPSVLTDVDRQVMKESLNRKGPVLGELRQAGDGSIYIDAVAPVVDEGGTAIALLVFRADAHAHLYPMIKSWPSLSPSAETVIMRLEGGRLRFLNELRHKPNSAFSLRPPLTDAENRAVNAVVGKPGLFRGKDYRNVDILADIRQIPGSSWYMVAKIDAEEVLGEATFRAGLIALAVLLFLLLFGLVTAYAYRQRQAHFYKTLYRSERAERESYEFFRTTLYSIGDAVITTDAEGKIRQMNPVAEQMTGWKEHEAQGRPVGDVFRIIDEQSRDDMENPVSRVLGTTATMGRTGHALLVAKDGTERAIAESGAPITDDRGTVIGAVMVFRDQTEERKAADALRKSEAKFRSYIEYSPMAVFVSDRQGKIVDVNPAAVGLLGYDVATLIGMYIWELHPLKNRDDVLADFVRFCREGRIEVESRFERSDGSRIWVALRASMIGDGLSLAYCADITRRKRAEEALRRYELLSSHSRDTMLLSDAKTGKILEANEAAEKAWGVTHEELLGMTVHDLREPSGYDLTPEQVAEVDIQGLLFETVALAKSGTTFPVEVSVRSATIGRKHVWINVIRDITARKRNLEEFELLKHSIDVHYDGAYWLDSDGRIIYANNAECKALGYEREELIGKMVYEINPDVVPGGPRLVWERLRKKGSLVVQTTHCRKDGTRFPVEIVMTHVQFGGREFACGFSRDVTEKRKLEAQLRQAQKMEAIGTLAGGVAHDFNNILTVIMGLANLIQMSVGARDDGTEASITARDERTGGLVNQIVVAAERAADLTQSLLAFSRKQKIAVAPHRVSDVVENAGKLLKRLLPEDVNLKIEISDPDAVSMLDIAQMDQVLMNLATNARDAMPGGGSFTIRTCASEIDERFRKTHGFGEPGKYARMSVSDTGVGMDEATMARIFDPFFTTKEVGKGTGLGLASVYGVVKQHNGYITVTSEPYKGTTFDVYLPLVEASGQEAVAEKAQVMGGTETILVIEDDADVRGLVTTVLSRQGYATLEAANGDEAIEVFRKNRRDVNLVILDVVMPGKNGKEVFEEIVRIDPKVRVIFVSGYTGDVVLDKGVREEGVDFLQKPLSVARLLMKVREVLDRGGSVVVRGM